MTIDRRRFLQLTATGIATIVAGAGCAVDANRDPKLVARPALLVAMDEAAVRDIGARYRETVPGERDAGALRSAIARDARRGLWLPWKPSPSLERQVSDDFAAGRTVVVRGWVLSVTEARQCALFSLDAG